MARSRSRCLTLAAPIGCLTSAAVQGVWVSVHGAGSVESVLVDRSAARGSRCEEGSTMRTCKSHCARPTNAFQIRRNQIRAMLERAGFVPRRFEIRTVTTVFRDVAQIIAFLQATTCSDLVP